MEFGSIIEWLEYKRLALNMSQAQFCMLLNPPSKNQTYATSRYNEFVHGKRRVTPLWYPGIAKFLGTTVEELERLAEGSREARKQRGKVVPFGSHKFSAEELSKLAEIAIIVGRSLSVEMMIRLCADIRAAGSS